MPNYLKMPKKSQVLALLELGWTYRRIEAETGVRRETVSRYDRARRANAAKTFPGSDVSPTIESPDLPAADESNAAKTFAGSPANAAKTFPGSASRPRFAAAVYRTTITEKLDAGLSGSTPDGIRDTLVRPAPLNHLVAVARTSVGQLEREILVRDDDRGSVLADKRMPAFE